MVDIVDLYVHPKSAAIVEVGDLGTKRVVIMFDHPKRLERNESKTKVEKELAQQGFVKIAEHKAGKWTADPRQQLAQERVRILDGLDALQNGKFKHGETNSAVVLAAVRKLVLEKSY